MRLHGVVLSLSTGTTLPYLYIYNKTALYKILLRDIRQSVSNLAAVSTVTKPKEICCCFPLVAATSMTYPDIACGDICPIREQFCQHFANQMILSLQGLEKAQS
jgi:hypothetical protein